MTVEGAKLDHSKVVDRKNKVVKTLVSGVGAQMRGAGVTVVPKTAVIKGKVTKAKAGKKLMTAYAPKLRFVSSDPTVARVEANGKVTPLAAGKCTVYVQTINGIWKTVSVTVQ